MGVFSGIKDAKVYSRGNYFQPGTYLVRIEKVKLFNDRMGIPTFVIESTILESDNPDLRAGMLMAQVIAKKNDAFLPNIKQFVAAANDVDPNDVDEAGVEMVVADDNPLRTEVMRVHAVNVPLKKDPTKVFTRLQWEMATVSEKARYSSKAA